MATNASDPQKREAFGNALRALRRYSGKSASDLAAILGVTHQQVYKYEIGQNSIKAEMIPEICRFLGVSIPGFFAEVSRQMKLGGGEGRGVLVVEADNE